MVLVAIAVFIFVQSDGVKWIRNRHPKPGDVFVKDKCNQSEPVAFYVLKVDNSSHESKWAEGFLKLHGKWNKKSLMWNWRAWRKLRDREAEPIIDSLL